MEKKKKKTPKQIKYVFQECFSFCFFFKVTTIYTLFKLRNVTQHNSRGTKRHVCYDRYKSAEERKYSYLLKTCYISGSNTDPLDISKSVIL